MLVLRAAEGKESAMSRHTGLIDAVNDAKTEWEHDRAEGFLEGWRAAMEECGRRWCFMEADLHTEARFPGRPYCCGVLIGWKPAEVKP
jgi:hypothetical protein